MFEKASRLKLRFPYKGAISTEDLWDLPVEVLDHIYREMNRELKGLQEDSLLAKKSRDGENLELRVSIVKHIAGVKLAETEEKEKAIMRREKVRRLDEIIARKQDAVLENKSIEELQKLREELGI
jgi:hypothetical protein